MTTIASAVDLKASGNAKFKSTDFVGAIGDYTRAIQLDAMDALLPLNRAMAYLKLLKFEDAERDCTTALRLSPKNAKALYRRGVARKGLQNYVSAIADLEEALAIDTANASIQNELAECQRLLQEAKAAARLKAAKAAAVRGRPARPAEPIEEPVASTSKATIQSDADPTLMREVSSRRISCKEKTGSFGAAKELRQAREMKQKSVLGIPAPNEGGPVPLARTTRANSATPADELVPQGSGVIRDEAPAPAPTQPRRTAITAYDFRIALNEYNTENADWKPAWSFIDSISTSHYASMFQSDLEPDVVATLLRTMRSASKDSREHANSACQIMDAISRSPRFDFVSLLLADTERTAAREILSAGRIDATSPKWKAWGL